MLGSSFGTSRKATLSLLFVSVATAPGVQAFELTSSNPDLRMRWDNTFRYNLSSRVGEQSDVLIEDANLDDGNRNFDKGVVSNRVDLLSEFDISYKRKYGARISAAAWYDAAYMRDSDNDSAATFNPTSVDVGKFPDDTKNLHSQKAELLDAFVFTRFTLGDNPLTLRAGQHTLVYGESLFFGNNGIANAQGPIDLLKLLTVPSSQFKEILRPVPQLSAVYQLTDSVSLGAYYQLGWQETVIPASGSYLSQADFVGEGAERFIAGGPLVDGGGAAAFWRGEDIEARDDGQGGFEMRWAPYTMDWEFGAYAARYHDKTPYLYLTPSVDPASGTVFDADNFDPQSGKIGTIQQVYAEDIDTFGFSATTSVGQLNLAMETSFRQNTPLVSDPQVVLPGVTADNSDNPLYAVGKSAHAQLSGIYVLQPSPLWDGGALLAEVAWNRRLSVDKNPAAIDPNTTRDAAALRLIFEPSYFQVLPGLDVSFPIGLGYNFSGRSSVIFNWNGGSSKAGDFSLGVKGTYRGVWEFGAAYVDFFGKEDGFLTPANSPTPVLSYKQSLGDRDFVTFNIKRAF